MVAWGHDIKARMWSNISSVISKSSCVYDCSMPTVSHAARCKAKMVPPKMQCQVRQISSFSCMSRCLYLTTLPIPALMLYACRALDQVSHRTTTSAGKRQRKQVDLTNNNAVNGILVQANMCLVKTPASIAYTHQKPLQMYRRAKVTVLTKEKSYNHKEQSVQGTVCTVRRPLQHRQADMFFAHDCYGLQQLVHLQHGDRHTRKVMQLLGRHAHWTAIPLLRESQTALRRFPGARNTIPGPTWLLTRKWLQARYLLGRSKLMYQQSLLNGRIY